MANGTAVNGRFTLEANSGRLPFSNLHEAEVEGRLLIHEATVSPGPLMRDVIDMVNQLQAIVVRRPRNIPRDRALLKIEDQTISYRLSRGRVHHEEIRFQVGGITLTSSGSVGLDETVNLVVQIPLPESWLTKSPLLQSLKGEAVPLVITGTLSRPSVDGRVLGDFGKRIGAKAAGGLLRRILEKAGLMIRATFLVVGVLVAGCGRDVANERDAIAPVAEGEVRSEPLQELFARHVLSSFVKQLRLADVVRDESWQFDKASGTLRFGDSIEYRVQVLGPESHGSDTWLWAWANEASKIPPGHLVAANRLRTFGHEQGIDELTTAMVSLDILDGHTAGMIASGVAVGNAYFRCPYEGGAMFVLITDPLTDSPVEADVIRTTRAIAEAFSNFEISNQRQVMLAYLRQRGIEVQVEGQTVQAVSEGKPWFTAEFDESNRLTSIKATAGPSADD
ncbi:Uncharacterized protein SCF082_LOCUS29335 [Durusdinium trenchii]|uniref:Uncharacterized protein n=1 Tax=Durusdinium trenchii TaxID=1381693 RepID=A0ABP0MR08_9DINO